MNRKLIISSLTYYSRGHSKEYIDNFYKHLNNEIDITLFNYGGDNQFRGKEVSVVGDAELLNYKFQNKISVYEKILKRFILSFFLYKNIYKFIKDRNKKGAEKIFFMDYEYISLLIFVYLLPRRVTPTIWLHSISTDGTLLYRVYKKVFFYLIFKKRRVKYIVNGEVAYNYLKRQSPTSQVALIQYPSELTYKPLAKKFAKMQLNLDGKKVISLIGMIRRDKNYKEAIKSYSKSKCNNDAQFSLLISGVPAGVSENEIISWLTKYNVNNYVLNLKYLTEQELNCAFSASDYLLIPYGMKGSSQSGPLSLSRNYKLPAIAHNGGEIGAYIRRENVGYLFDSFDDLPVLLNSIHSNSVADVDTFIVAAQKKYSWYAAKKRYVDFM